MEIIKELGREKRRKKIDLALDSIRVYSTISIPSIDFIREGIREVVSRLHLELYIERKSLGPQLTRRL